MTEKQYIRILRKVRLKLQAAHLPSVAEETGVKYGTVYKIAKTISARPELFNLMPLAKHLGVNI